MVRNPAVSCQEDRDTVNAWAKYAGGNRKRRQVYLAEGIHVSISRVRTTIMTMEFGRHTRKCFLFVLVTKLFISWRRRHDALTRWAVLTQVDFINVVSDTWPTAYTLSPTLFRDGANVIAEQALAEKPRRRQKWCPCVKQNRFRTLNM